MVIFLDKDIMKELFNTNEFKGWLLSRRWFGDKSTLSDLNFKVRFEYFQLVADRLLLTVLIVKTATYSKKYFLPLLFYKKLNDVLEPSEINKENVILITENTFTKKLVVSIENENKILDINLVEAEYILFFWRLLLFDKTLSEDFPKYSLDLSLYTEQFEDEKNMTKVQNLIEASLFPDRYQLTLQQLGKGNTTNTLFLLSIKDLKKENQEYSYVIKSYKEYAESLEPAKLFVLVKNKFPNAPKIYGTIQLNKIDVIGIQEKVNNIGNVGEIYWNELNTMVNLTFSKLDQDFSKYKEKPEINSLIEKNCKETLKLSQELGGYIEKLHEAMILPGLKDYKKESRKSAEFLTNYTNKLNAIIAEIQHVIKTTSGKGFFNLPKINSILMDTIDIMLRFKQEFEFEDITVQPTHQDLHMEQILYNKENGNYTYYFIDFEGDPQLSFEEKKEKFPIEKDIASFLRSLSYIKFNTFLGFIENSVIQKDEFEVPESVLYSIFFKKAAKSTERNKILAILLNVLNTWEKKLIGIFLKSLDEKRVYIPLINYFTIERALHEINYEILFRPNKIIVPILGLDELIKQY